MRIKRITAILLIGLLFVLTACASPTATAPPPDIPRYTADQVIVVAQAQYSGYSSSKGHTPALVSVSYQGKGIWQIIISAPRGYYLEGPRGIIAGTVLLHFNEATNSLK